METTPRVKIVGSYKVPSSNFPSLELDKSQTAQVTVRLRRKKSLHNQLATGQIISRETYQSSYGASVDDAEAIEAFAQKYHLTTISVDLARRSVIIAGKLSDLEEAFRVELKGYETEQGKFRKQTGDIYVPAYLQEIITGVLGLDNNPVARPKLSFADNNGIITSHTATNVFDAGQLAKIYDFPSGVSGIGQCIAIIELGGGFRSKDLINYFKGIGINPPNVKAIAVDGEINNPTTANSADSEVMLDIEVVGAVAPGARIVVYFSSNTDQGFLNAITQAIHDPQNKPSIITISWGEAESNWTQQALDNINEAFKTAAALGITVCVAAGDSGSRDDETDGKVHVDFPASSPYALACGGTKLIAHQNKIISETAWHESSNSASGGGVSNYFPLPDYQLKTGVPLAIDTLFKGRGVPDVAANADPDTGYKVLVDGQQFVIGGTSAVAPLMAGLIALFNEQQKLSAGFIHPLLYSNPGLCRDITTGNNKTTINNTGYTASTGWDACTGLGVLYKLR